ncbi:MAG: archaemetzincin family Zn-dependent metalloprotease [Halococcoides sp.]
MDVDIVPIGDISGPVKREASRALRSIYDFDVFVRDVEPIPESAYDDKRNQYRAETLIDLVSSAGSADKNLGLTEVDLFYSRRNFVFGLAYLRGEAGIVSTNRLRMRSDGGLTTRSDRDMFADRLRTEVTHEIGHTLGLEHCDDERCVMHFSPTVRDVDQKDEHLCGTCANKLDS